MIAVIPTARGQGTEKGRFRLGSFFRRTRKATGTKRKASTTAKLPVLISQVSTVFPKNGEMQAAIPSATTPTHGVLYLGCSFPNADGRNPDSESANKTRLPPIIKAFQLVNIPPIPPITSRTPAEGWFHARVAASAVAIVEVASSAGGIVIDTANEIPAYHSTARTRDAISRIPIFRAGKSISSADCGITSKPTSIPGTIISTTRMPEMGIATGGFNRRFSVFAAAPTMSVVPARKMSAVTMVWIIAANRMPKMLMTVIRIALPTPIKTKPISTSDPRICHSEPIRMLGNRYSIAVGKATDSKRHTVA